MNTTYLKRVLVACIMLLVPYYMFAQALQGYQVTGHINGLREGTKVVMKMMVYNPGEAVEVPRDSAYVKNGEFVIKGVVEEGPRIYWLNIADAQAHIYRMFIDNGENIQLTYSGNISKVKFQLLDRYLVCEGSPSQHAAQLAERMDDVFDLANQGYRIALKKVRDSIGYDPTAVRFLLKSHDAFVQLLVKLHLSNITPDLLPAAGFLGLYEDADHSAFWADIYDQMDDHLRNSVLGKKMKNRLPLLVGAQMPPFSLPDASGKDISLKDVIAKSKVTLVHFWANNSAQRQEYDLELRSMYKLFHDKGLSIIGVSTETLTDKWKTALAQENYPWINVADPKGARIVDPVYHELGQVDHQNTTNVLIDSQGRIIAWDPTDVVLQYYLSKALDN